VPGFGALPAYAATPSAGQQADADELAPVEAAFNAKDYEKAFALAKPLAEKGNAKAQILVATLYNNGVGTKRNTAEAIK
jgi:TPR repeat protein